MNKIYRNLILSDTPPKNTNELWVSPVNTSEGKYTIKAYLPKETEDGYVLYQWIPLDTSKLISELAKVATSGDYNDLTNLPDLSVYADNTDVKTSLSKKEDKTTRREVSGISSIMISPNEYTIITLDRDVTITLTSLPINRTYAGHYEFDIITEDEVYEVGFANASSYTWAKELVIEPNKIYKFYVDDDYTIIWQAIERSEI